MKNKEAAIARIQTELKDSPEKLETIISQWQNFDEQTVANQNTKATPNLPDTQGRSRSPQNFVGLPAYYGYDNYVIQSRNTCGQAVIGSFVDFYNKNPFNQQRNVPGWDNKMHFDNMAFIGSIFHQYGPNYPVPNGVTVRETIMEACRAYGLQYNEYYPGAYSNGADSHLELTNWIAKYNMPVAVLVDAGTNIFNDPKPYTLHWCTVYAYDTEGVFIATWAKSYKVTWAVFMDAWHCWWLPYPNNYYQLRVWA